jgi:aryl-alcohol dehydrogenase-like predicted oxidoreductase
VDALSAIAKKKNASIAQVALAWLLAQAGVTSIIIGANKMSQLEDNLKAADLELSPEEIEDISRTNRAAALYPQWMSRANERR